jgi:hypothetical protein
MLTAISVKGERERDKQNKEVKEGGKIGREKERERKRERERVI